MARIELLGVARQDHDDRVVSVPRGALPARAGSEEEQNESRRASSATVLSMRRVPVALLATALAFAAAANAHAQARDDLATRLAALVAAARLGDAVSISVADAASGDPIFRHHGDLALNPASNVKLVTAATALDALGPAFTMETTVHGVRDGAGHVPVLVLRGRGDPTLEMEDLVELAAELARDGVRTIGDVVVDGSYFDDQILPPAFEQQPGEVAAFRAPVGAVAVDRASYVLRVIPSARVGDPARVVLRGAAYFDVSGVITTSERGAPAVVADQRDAGDRMRLTLRGTIPVTSRPVAYRRRVEHPLRHAGHLFAEALRLAGIEVRGGVALGAGPEGAPLLATHRSAPLARVLEAMGKHSENFVAETILKVVGASRAAPGTTAAGIEAAEALLARAGVPEGASTLVNGSGLFQGNRIASDHLVRLLVHVYRDSRLRPEFLAHLSIGGVDGTLASRLRDLPVGTSVRAKTGTLDDAIALSGYVLGDAPGEAVVFSVLTNGIRGRQGRARTLADGVARAIAEDLTGARAAP
jgi:D-alanyl-D-alanine carboxypeptidase/D-alanyl-D-alanine-endopeptidase (penicillin-binding protein 4)